MKRYDMRLASVHEKDKETSSEVESAADPM